MNEIQKKAGRRLAVYGGLSALFFLYWGVSLAGFGLPCLFQSMFHVTCPGCGATRALFSLLRLDFAGAAAYHGVFAFGLFPILALIVLQDLLLCIHSLATGKEHLSFLRYLSGGNLQSFRREAKA